MNKVIVIGSILFIIILAFVMIPEFGSSPGQPTAAQYAIAELSRKVEAFHADTGRYPTDAEGLHALVECPKDVPPKRWHGPYLVEERDPLMCHDPWLGEYHYQTTPQSARGVSYKITSPGKDGILGTADDISNETKNLPWAYHEPFSEHFRRKLESIRYIFQR